MTYLAGCEDHRLVCWPGDMYGTCTCIRVRYRYLYRIPTCTYRSDQLQIEILIILTLSQSLTFFSNKLKYSAITVNMYQQHFEIMHRPTIEM